MRVWPVDSVAQLRSPTRAIPGSFEVDIEDCTSFVGFSYRSGGWNPYVETIAEILSHSALEYEDSTLRRLYEKFTPRTLQELFVEDSDRTLEPLSSLPTVRELFRYVWILSPRRLKAFSSHRSAPTGHHYFGPQNEKAGRAAFDRLRRVLESIQREGFDPGRYGAIRGYFLSDGSSHRFVVGSGNHRLAVLKALGHMKAPVALNSSHPAVIMRSRLDSWTVEKGGPFQAETAHVLFDKLFEEDGNGKARSIGLVES